MPSDETAPPAKRQRTEIEKDEPATTTTSTSTSTTTKATDNATNGFNAAADINNDADLKPSSPTAIPLLPRDVKVLLLDIEGCTTSISFVKDSLFPFALSNLPEYLKSIEEQSDTKDKDLNDLLKSLKDDISKLDSDHPSRKEIGSGDAKDGDGNVKDDIIAHVKALMSHDVKATGLKALQGKIWKNGYATGQLKGHIYQDFIPLLDWCKALNVSVNIYSSGSIGAQKLLFGHSSGGDICHYFNSHFDTTSGGKKEAESYKTIAKALDVDVKDLCFVSDAEAELVAAREAGVGYVVMSVRPGNAPLTDVGREFPIVYSLLQLCGSGK